MYWACVWCPSKTTIDRPLERGVCAFVLTASWMNYSFLGFFGWKMLFAAVSVLPFLLSRNTLPTQKVAFQIPNSLRFMHFTRPTLRLEYFWLRIRWLFPRPQGFVLTQNLNFVVILLNPCECLSVDSPLHPDSGGKHLTPTIVSSGQERSISAFPPSWRVLTRRDFLKN